MELLPQSLIVNQVIGFIRTILVDHIFACINGRRLYFHCDFFIQGLVTFKDFSNMMYAARNIPIGTMTFTLKEEEVYVRVTDGFKQIQVNYTYLATADKKNLMFILKFVSVCMIYFWNHVFREEHLG